MFFLVIFITNEFLIPLLLLCFFLEEAQNTNDNHTIPPVIGGTPNHMRSHQPNKKFGGRFCISIKYIY